MIKHFIVGSGKSYDEVFSKINDMMKYLELQDDHIFKIELKDNEDCMEKVNYYRAIVVYKTPKTFMPTKHGW